MLRLGNLRNFDWRAIEIVPGGWGSLEECLEKCQAGFTDTLKRRRVLRAKQDRKWMRIVHLLLLGDVSYAFENKSPSNLFRRQWDNHGISRHLTFDLEVNTFGYIAKAIGPHDVLDSVKKGWFVADDWWIMMVTCDIDSHSVCWGVLSVTQGTNVARRCMWHLPGKQRKTTCLPTLILTFAFF